MMSFSVMLLMALQKSSFFLNDYLTDKIVQKNHNGTQLTYAVKQNNIAALIFSWKNSIQHSKQWLLFAKQLAKTEGEAAYQLAIYYQGKNEYKKMVFWLESAIRLEYYEASIALAEYFFQKDKFNKAKKVLKALSIEQADEIIIAAITLNVNIAISQGNVFEIENLTRHYAKLLQKKEAGRLLLVDMKKYQVQLNEMQKRDVKKFIPSCDNSIQLFATNLKHLRYLEKLIVEFKTQEMNQFVCFSPVRYMPINALDCSNNPNVAIQCNELSWQQWAKEINTRYVGLMLPKGGANVHLGILYFDSQDTGDVLAHEISHLLGFVDEYTLPIDHVKCQLPQKEIFAQNISVLKKQYKGKKEEVRASILKQLAWAKYIKNDTPILQSVSGAAGTVLWQLGTPKEFAHEIGLFSAKTCDGVHDKLTSQFTAFKSVSKHTKLEYFTLPFTKFYVNLLQTNSMEYRMPSFHYNIALAHFQQVIEKKANNDKWKTWVEQAESWENNDTRREKVRKGLF